MFRLDDATEKDGKYYFQMKDVKSWESGFLSWRVRAISDPELKEKFQLSAEQISCLQNSALDIPSANHEEFHKYNLIK